MAEDHWGTVRGAVKDFSNYRDIFLKNMAGESDARNTNIKKDTCKMQKNFYFLSYKPACTQTHNSVWSGSECNDKLTNY